MKVSSKNSIKSMTSLILILSSLFVIAFLQMEERRQTYHLLKLNKDLKQMIETRRSLEIKRLNALRPQKIEKEIQARTALNQAQSEQIIHMPNPMLNPMLNSRLNPNLNSFSGGSSLDSSAFLNGGTVESNL